MSDKLQRAINVSRLEAATCPRCKFSADTREVVEEKTRAVGYASTCPRCGLEWGAEKSGQPDAIESWWIRGIDLS